MGAPPPEGVRAVADMWEQSNLAADSAHKEMPPLPCCSKSLAVVSCHVLLSPSSGEGGDLLRIREYCQQVKQHENQAFIAAYITVSTKTFNWNGHQVLHDILWPP